ncbi:MAG: hypothetical protein NW223_23980 [Hyphomicrobiaceae bacterium]|nr:hypothetical protein [Hyphomicrobiaceae bacterium]
MSRLFLFLFMLVVTVEVAEANGCASRGGPGWRNSKGDCVGWKALPGACKFPPETRCSFEGHAYLWAVPPGATLAIWKALMEKYHLGVAVNDPPVETPKQPEAPKQQAQPLK